MRNGMIKIAALVSTFGIVAFAQPTQFADAVGLHASNECLLSLVRGHLNVKKSAPSAPVLKLESETPLAEFQTAMESFWKFRPDIFVNVYDVEINTIFLTNKLSNYTLPRQPMDSLIHELTHFVQVIDLNGGSGDADLLEIEAIQVQEWFRENYSPNIVNGQYQGPCSPAIAAQQ